ncbi:hypothetical protein AAC387_Pa07g1568 [Persea americana]
MGISRYTPSRRKTGFKPSHEVKVVCLSFQRNVHEVLPPVLDSSSEPPTLFDRTTRSKHRSFKFQSRDWPCERLSSNDFHVGTFFPFFNKTRTSRV